MVFRVQGTYGLFKSTCQNGTTLRGKGESDSLFARAHPRMLGFMGWERHGCGRICVHMCACTSVFVKSLEELLSSFLSQV